MRTHVQKWGNSLALRIPRGVVAEAGLAEGAPVELTVEGGRLVVVPALRPTLNALLADVTEDNLHAVVDTGPAVGDEAW